MIKVLVVDDDKLVRKGLISAMPWQQFGMEVVGEASNGEKALEFLEREEVDLLLTDLAMPVMSGIELMRIVKKEYPAISIVVLTLHQDFEYIQEALRLDAIDYIAKVQLEKEQFEEILGRIVNRIQEKSPKKITGHTNHRAEPQTVNCGFAVVSLEQQDYQVWAPDLRLPVDVTMIEVNRNSWLWLAEPCDAEQLARALMNKVGNLSHTVLLELTGLRGRSRNEIVRRIRDYTDSEIFYDYHPSNKRLVISMSSEHAQVLQDQEERLDKLKELWLSAEWLYQDALFNQLISEMKLLKLQQTKLIGLLYAFVNDWNRQFAHAELGKLKLAEPIYSWYQIEQWIEELRRLIRHSAEKTNYSQDIINCILKAALIMENEMDQPLTASDMAKRMNMSRSYFSLCFKDIIGNTFNEHIRKIRMEKAKEYLTYTNKTILWIAENTGYMDEKYFSRTFRDQTGMLPSEYRLSKRSDK